MLNLLNSKYESYVKETKMKAKSFLSVIVDYITIDTEVDIEISGLILEGKKYFQRVPCISYTYRIDNSHGTSGSGNFRHIYLYVGKTNNCLR